MQWKKDTSLYATCTSLFAPACFLLDRNTHHDIVSHNKAMRMCLHYQGYSKSVRATNPKLALNTKNRTYDPEQTNFTRDGAVWDGFSMGPSPFFSGILLSAKPPQNPGEIDFI